MKGKKPQKQYRKQLTDKLSALQQPTFLSGYGGVRRGNEKEILFKTIEYFDYTATSETPVHSHSMSMQQSYLGHRDSSNIQLSRPKAGKLFAMPKFANGDQTNQVFTVLSGVRMSNSSIASVSQMTTTGQSNATVIPEASPRWVEVASWDYDELFNQNWYRPVLHASQDDEAFFEAFALSVIDPDDFKSFKGEVQFRFEYEFTQTLPVDNLVRELVADLADWTTTPSGTPANVYAMVQPKKMTNIT